MQSRRSFESRFNTQPPEGGWAIVLRRPARILGFNTQPPEGGWTMSIFNRMPKRGFNTQPPEGGWVQYHPFQGRDTVSTHSRLKVAGYGKIG